MWSGTWHPSSAGRTFCRRAGGTCPGGDGCATVATQLRPPPRIPRFARSRVTEHPARYGTLGRRQFVPRGVRTEATRAPPFPVSCVSEDAPGTTRGWRSPEGEEGARRREEVLLWSSSARSLDHGITLELLSSVFRPWPASQPGQAYPRGVVSMRLRYAAARSGGSASGSCA